MPDERQTLDAKQCKEDSKNSPDTARGRDTQVSSYGLAERWTESHGGTSNSNGKCASDDGHALGCRHDLYGSLESRDKSRSVPRNVSWKGQYSGDAEVRFPEAFGI